MLPHLIYLSCCAVLISGLSLLPTWQGDYQEKLYCSPAGSNYPTYELIRRKRDVVSPVGAEEVEQQVTTLLPALGEEQEEPAQRLLTEQELILDVLPQAHEPAILLSGLQDPEEQELISEVVPQAPEPAEEQELLQEKMLEQTENEQPTELVPRDGTDACPISAERGLTRLIRNARPLLPVERLGNILGHAADDAEVRELLVLLRSDQFRERVKALRATREEGILRDYICQGLKLNHVYFLDFVRVFLNWNTTQRPSGPKPQGRRRGVRGLLQDLRDALPRNQLRDLYRRQLATDNELSAAVRRIRSTEFRRLLGNVRALPEYRVVRSLLERAGVPLQEVLNLVSNALGWGPLDLGGETLIA